MVFKGETLYSNKTVYGILILEQVKNMPALVEMRARGLDLHTQTFMHTIPFSSFHPQNDPEES